MLLICNSILVAPSPPSSNIHDVHLDQTLPLWVIIAPLLVFRGINRAWRTCNTSISRYTDAIDLMTLQKVNSAFRCESFF